MLKKYSVELSAAAERDLGEILDFIAEDDPANAVAWMDRLRDRTRSLERFPDRGIPIPEAIAGALKYRQLVEGDYRVIYTVEARARRVVVRRVVHGARLLDVENLGE